MTKPRKPPKLVSLLNVGQRSVERWIESRPDRPSSLTSAQVGALFYLSHHDGALIGELAHALAIGASAMSGMANRMEQAALIIRQRDIADGRSTRLYLTEEGRLVAQRAKSELAVLNAKLTDGFTDAEMEVVARWLEAVPGKLETVTTA